MLAENIVLEGPGHPAPPEAMCSAIARHPAPPETVAENIAFDRRGCPAHSEAMVAAGEKTREPVSFPG